MLFVDASNAPAVGLYRALGFVTSRIDRAYGRALP
jgi:ribosomal protein S18 acetylase RimI-like enzyme